MIELTADQITALVKGETVTAEGVEIKAAEQADTLDLFLAILDASKSGVRSKDEGESENYLDIPAFLRSQAD